MHTNWRRKNRHKSHWPGNTWCYGPKSCKEYQRISWQKRRTHVRELLHHERWDDIPCRYPRNILWDWL